jgi:hypothetical protein
MSRKGNAFLQENLRRFNEKNCKNKSSPLIGSFWFFMFFKDETEPKQLI